MTHSILNAAYVVAANSPIVAQTTAFLFSGSHLVNEFAPAYDFCVCDCRVYTKGRFAAQERIRTIGQKPPVEVTIQIQ